ncbi:hypothetical protein [uncultured Umboniibacter sp.]|uniref:hypothetical protein n=1 Tax=uncultured Umboniibacter sp. TaxID=1798917 RepID=UPI002612C4F7|nr:hypothetical protein [uncultured Umboniibacter sp.]
MILRKLAAVTIASSVMASGAFAASDTADTSVTLTLNEAVEVVTATTLAFPTDSDSGASVVEANGLCTWSSTGNFNLTVASANSFNLVNSVITGGATAGLDASESIGYSLETTSGSLDLTDGSTYTVASGPLTNSAARCTSTPDWVSVTATLDETTGSKETGSYSDTVTFTIESV